MVIATPFEKEKAFYYNQKIIGMRARGDVYKRQIWTYTLEDIW